MIGESCFVLHYPMKRPVKVKFPVAKGGPLFVMLLYPLDYLKDGHGAKVAGIPLPGLRGRLPKIKEAMTWLL